MTVDTLLVAVGEAEETNTDAVVGAVRTVAAGETTTVLAHAFDEETYDRASEELSEGERGDTGQTDREDEWRSSSADDWPVAAFGGNPAIAPVENPSAEAEEVRDEAKTDESVGPDQVAAQYRTIRDIADGLDDTGIEYEIRGRVGDPAETVLAIADEVAADAITVDRRDRGTVKQALFGSVSEEIIEHAERPVVVV